MTINIVRRMWGSPPQDKYRYHDQEDGRNWQVLQQNCKMPVRVLQEESQYITGEAISPEWCSRVRIACLQKNLKGRDP